MRGTLIGLAVVIVGVVALVTAPIPTPDEVFTVTPAHGLESDRGGLPGTSTWTTLRDVGAWRFDLRVVERDVTLRVVDTSTRAATFLDLATSLAVRDAAFEPSTPALLLAGGDARRGAVVERFDVGPFDGAVRRDDDYSWRRSATGSPSAEVVRREWFVDPAARAAIAVAVDPADETAFVLTDDGTLRQFALVHERLDVDVPLAAWTTADAPRLAEVSGATAGDVTVRPFSQPDGLAFPRHVALHLDDAVLLVPAAPPGPARPPLRLVPRDDLVSILLPGP